MTNPIDPLEVPVAPATLDEFLESRASGWVELASLADRARRSPAEAVRLSRLHRSATADLALARRRWPGDPAVEALETLVGRSHGALYAPGWAPSLLGSRRAEVWSELRHRAPPTLGALTVLVAAALAAGLWAGSDSSAGGRLVSVGLRRDIASGSWHLPVGVLAVLLAFAGGLLGAVGAAVVLVWVGAEVGATVAIALDHDEGTDALGLLVTGSPLVSALVLAAGLGAAAGWPKLARDGPAPRWAARAADAAALFAVTLPLVVVGGLLVEAAEAPIEPALVVVGAGVTIAWWTMVVILGPGPSRRGRPGTLRPPADPAPPT